MTDFNLFGLTGGLSPARLHAINHVLTHGVPGWKAPPHLVFAKTTGTKLELDRVLPLVDEAWGKKANATLIGTSSTGEQFYRIPMGKTVGTNGDDHIVIFVKQGTSEVRTEFPCNANYIP